MSTHGTNRWPYVKAYGQQRESRESGDSIGGATNRDCGVVGYDFAPDDGPDDGCEAIRASSYMVLLVCVFCIGV